MNTPNPAIVTQRAAQPLPRLALLLFLRRLPDPWPDRKGALEECGHCCVRLHGQAGQRRDQLAEPDGRRAASRGRVAGALLDRRGIHQAVGLGRRAGNGGTSAVRHAARTGDGPDLVHHLPPGPNRSGKAGRLRLRRRGQDHRLRTCPRRRGLARIDRHAGPAAARPRDDTRTGATDGRRPLALLGGRGAVQALAVARWPDRSVDPDGHQRRSQHRHRVGDHRCRFMLAVELPAGACAGAMGHRGRRGRRCGGHRPPCLGLARHRRRFSRAGGVVAQAVRLVHVARLAVGALDALALARSPGASSYLGAPQRCVARPVRLWLHGCLGPRVDARPAWDGGTRRVCATHHATKGHVGHRLVLGLLLHVLCPCDLGHLRIAHDGGPRQACFKRHAAGARLPAGPSRLSASSPRRWPLLPGYGW